MRKTFLLFLSLFFFQFSFPKDHSFHTNYGLEWIYFVGNLKSDTGEKYGYELSFFRVKLKDEAQSEIFPVHFAISDVTNKTHHEEQILKRNLGGIAGFTDSKIWSGEYEVQIKGKDEFFINVQPKSGKISLELTLKGQTPVFPQGPNGISRKSHINPSIFSNYYSYPRLNTNGNLKIQNKSISIVSGLSWMDHEWSEKNDNSINQYSLASKESGWDWICLSGEDGSDYVFFRFHELDGKHSVFGSKRTKSGKITYFDQPNSVKMVPTGGTWKSKKTGIQYPLEWKIEYPGGVWEVTPSFNEQEFDGRKSTGIVYWEGMVTAKNNLEKISSEGYLELKGYKKKKDWWEF